MKFCAKKLNSCVEKYKEQISTLKTGDEKFGEINNKKL